MAKGKIVSVELGDCFSNEKFRGFRLNWVVEYPPGEWIMKNGWGQLEFFVDKETGKLSCDNETMPKEFVEEALLLFARNAELTD